MESSNYLLIQEAVFFTGRLKRFILSPSWCFSVFINKHLAISALLLSEPNVKFKFRFSGQGFYSMSGKKASLDVEDAFLFLRPVKYIYRSSCMVSDLKQKKYFITEEKNPWPLCQHLSASACSPRLARATGLFSDLSNSAAEEWSRGWKKTQWTVERTKKCDWTKEGKGVF